MNVRFQKKIGGKRDFETKKNLSNIYRYLLFTKQNYSTTLHTHTHTNQWQRTSPLFRINRYVENSNVFVLICVHHHHHRPI